MTPISERLAKMPKFPAQPRQDTTEVMHFVTHDKVAESNRIEGILRAPTKAELDEFTRFMALDEVSVVEMCKFVGVYQPGAYLRVNPGMNVRVGNHLPPVGGPVIQQRLDNLLYKANMNPGMAWEIHVEYETLHPFMDGNGRSGRMLWYWCMDKSQQRMADLGFLHAFYYQTLTGVRPSNLNKHPRRTPLLPRPERRGLRGGE